MPKSTDEIQNDNKKINSPIEDFSGTLTIEDIDKGISDFMSKDEKSLGDDKDLRDFIPKDDIEDLADTLDSIEQMIKVHNEFEDSLAMIGRMRDILSKIMSGSITFADIENLIKEVNGLDKNVKNEIRNVDKLAKKTKEYEKNLDKLREKSESLIDMIKDNISDNINKDEKERLDKIIQDTQKGIEAIEEKKKKLIPYFALMIVKNITKGIQKIVEPQIQKEAKGVEQQIEGQETKEKQKVEKEMKGIQKSSKGKDKVEGSKNRKKEIEEKQRAIANKGLIKVLNEDDKQTDIAKMVLNGISKEEIDNNKNEFNQLKQENNKAIEKKIKRKNSEYYSMESTTTKEAMERIGKKIKTDPNPIRDISNSKQKRNVKSKQGEKTL